MSEMSIEPGRATIGLGNGDGRLRYVHFEYGPSNLRGWRVDYNRVPAPDSSLHRWSGTVTDPGGTEYKWARHQSRTDGDGMPCALGWLELSSPVCTQGHKVQWSDAARGYVHADRADDIASDHGEVFSHRLVESREG